MRNTLPPSSFIQKAIATVIFYFTVIYSSPGQISVSLDSSYAQTMDGFGVSVNYTPGRILNLTTDSMRQMVYDLLFTDKGANLSLVRMQMNRGGTRLNGADSIGMFTMRDNQQQVLAQVAKDRGVEHFYCSPWTAPPEFKKNDTLTRRYSTDPDNYVLVDNYEDYARWMVRYINNYERYRGIRFKTMGIQNEPDFITTAWSTCEWTPATLRDYTRILIEKMDSAGVDINIMMPESAGWTSSLTYAQAAMQDSICEEGVDILASHGYNAGTSASLYSLAAQFNKPVWQTEWSDFNPFTTSIADGLTWSARIADNLNRGNVSGWSFWGIMSTTDNQGLFGGNVNNDQVYITKRFWTMAQYSRFVRPGAKRIKISGISDPWYISAFLNASNTDVALIVHNGTALTDSININLSSYEILDNNVKAFRTSATESMDTLPDLQIINNALQITRVPGSVTTYLLKIAPKFTGIEQRDFAKNQMQIFPNPVQDKITVKYFSENNSASQLRIYDVTGRLVQAPWEGEIATGSNEIILDTAQIPSGIYYCRLYLNEKGISITKTLIKL